MSITKTGGLLGNAAKFLMKDSKSITGALGLGMGTMSVTGGMNSVGGEAAGGVAGLAGGNMGRKIMKSMGLGKLSILGAAAGGMYGYSKGSDLANKYIPIYKRGGSGNPQQDRAPSFANPTPT